MKYINKTASRIIDIGIALSIVLFSSGILLLVAQGGAPGVFVIGSAGIPLNLNTSSYPLAKAVAHPSGITLIYAGLFALVATPISVVSLLLYDFVRERNRIYAVIAAFVLLAMLVAILLIPALLR